MTRIPEPTPQVRTYPVIEVAFLRGSGESPADMARMVRALYDEDGALIVEMDPLAHPLNASTLADVLTERHVALEGGCGESHLADAEDIVRRYARRSEGRT